MIVSKWIFKHQVFYAYEGIIPAIADVMAIMQLQKGFNMRVAPCVRLHFLPAIYLFVVIGQSVLPVADKHTMAAIADIAVDLAGFAIDSEGLSHAPTLAPLATQSN